jgi:ATP-dependent helicase/nuclease subunit A
VHEHPKGAEAALADAQAVRSLLVDEILPPGGLLASLSLLDHEKHPSPPVAILIRRRTHLALLEHQLRLARVPHVFQGGIGFWDRQEVLDVANTLHALCLNDAISLVGALRSPLFGLSDDAIHALSRAGGLHGFGPARRYPGEPTESAVWEPAVEEARRRWMTLRALRHRLPPSRFLCMLYETCDAAALAWRQDENGQAWANLLRLLDLAGRYDAMGGRGIPAFTRRLLDRINQGSREEQASIAANEARVVLLTVHAAKGLEFPVVILPDLSAGPRGETGGLVIGRLASDWHFATLVPDTSASALGRASPGLREALRDRLGREREAEDLRLFYVACTRACDHLFLVGGRPPPPKDRQASGWVGLLDAVGWGRVADPVDDVLHELPPPQEPFSVLPLPPRDLPLPDPRRLADAAPLDLSCLHDVSPSGIDLFAECPARWMRARHLGIPELARGPIERGKELAALRGSVIHALLEEDALDDISSARRRWLGEARALGANDEEIDRGLGIVLAHLRKARQDEALHALRTAEGWNELRFRLPIGDLVLQGTIDRLCRPVGSEGWLVLDYKSTRATGHVEEVTRKYRRQMLTYALAAATLLGAPLPNGVRAALYFTEPGVLCLLPPWHEQEIADLEGLLKCMGAILKGARTWVEVEGEATRSPRPCATCGYRGRGCRGARRIPGDPNRDEIAD